MSKIVTTTVRCDGCAIETLVDGDGLPHGWGYYRLSRRGSIEEKDLCTQCADAVEWALRQRSLGRLNTVLQGE